MSSPATETFRRRVRFVMQERDLSITELAAKTGMLRPAISRLLSGDEGITLARAERIANALGIPLAEMLTEKFLPIANSA